MNQHANRQETCKSKWRSLFELKGPLNPIKFQTLTGFSRGNSQDVEAARNSIGQLQSLQVALRCPPQLALFAAVDTLDGAAEIAGSAVAHLHKHQLPRGAHDQVDFTELILIIHAYQLQPLFGEITGSELFLLLAKGARSLL